MSVVAAAIIGAAVVGAGGVYMASEAQKDAAKKSAKAQKDISDQSLQLQRELVDTQREDFEPWRDAGERALTQIDQGIQSGEFVQEKFDPSKIDVTQDPGYKFRLEQGIDARDKSAASRGRLLSGAQEKGVERYAQNLASQEYGNAYSRYVGEYAMEDDRRARKYNILSAMSGQGQASAARQAGAVGQLGITSANILASQARAASESERRQGEADAQAAGGYAQTANQAAQNWLLYKNQGAK